MIEFVTSSGAVLGSRSESPQESAKRLNQGTSVGVVQFDMDEDPLLASLTPHIQNLISL